MRPSFLTLALAGLLAASTLPAADLKLLLPQGRTAFQTNEQIDVAVVRSDAAALPAGNLVLTATGADGSTLAFTFPVAAVPVAGADARTTEHLHLNGWLLRPGKYTLTAAADGATGTTALTVYSHVRRSSYRTIHWGGPRGPGMAPEGEDGLGFNLMFGGVEEPSIVAGMDVMGNCVMGGMHQHDGNLECDWSDPNVTIGAIQRGLDVAFTFRTMPNAIGAHLHDEPGLTWQPHPRLKGPDGKPQFIPHDIAPQRAAFQRAFGVEPIWFDQVDVQVPTSFALWTQVSDFKLGFMDAFWKTTNDAMTRLKPGFLAVTQTQYGWTALFDGYYFNVARSLPVISGHGGYNDYWQRNFNPSFYLEFSLPRQTDKPTWYLPEWYGNISPAEFRLEHYLSFITGIQGMSTPPGLGVNSPGTAGIVEANQTLARLGTIFAKPALTRAPLAILYSKSNTYFLKEQAQPGALAQAYAATKLIQYPFTAVLDEDIVDGTLAAGHQALLLTGVKYLAPAVVAGLEAFIKDGGTVLLTDDCTVTVAGAEKLGVAFDDYTTPGAAKIKALTDKDAIAKATLELNSFYTMLQHAAPLAKALQVALQKHGIAPAFGVQSAPPAGAAGTLAAGQQVRGEIEYLFAVNFTVDGHGTDGLGNLLPLAAKLSVPDNGRPVYDALRGAAAVTVKDGKNLVVPLSFGPGALQVLARPARAIGGVSVGAPALTRDFTRTDAPPVTLDFSATLLDAAGKTLAGTAPLQITVTDPLGAPRYQLFRATDAGVLALSLPLAANDPAGNWTVRVEELLSHTSGSATVAYKPAAQLGAAAGASARAVYFAADEPNIFRFFRDQRQVTIVKGDSAYCAAAAERLASALLPFNVTCTIITTKEANVPRALTAEQAQTWCGTSNAGHLKTGRENSPANAGFDLPQPVILLGNPADNPLVKFLADKKVTPYALTADFPGRGHGMLAWNLNTLGHDVQAIAILANDEAGLNEGVGTLYELATGLAPVTPLVLPAANRIQPATQLPPAPPAATIAWRARLPDRGVSLSMDGATLVATSLDGAQTRLGADGKIAGTTPAATAATEPKAVTDTGALPKDQLVPGLTVRHVLAGDGRTAVAYLGGTLQVFDAAGKVQSQQVLPGDISALAWSGKQLLAALASGELLALQVP